LPKASLDALDLVRQLLQFDPDKRISAANAIDHPFLAGFRTGDEPVCNKIMRLGVDDNLKLKPDEYQTLLYQELDRKRQEVDAKYHQALVHISS
jgi:mitogen-activated protein kinase 15